MMFRLGKYYLRKLFLEFMQIQSKKNLKLKTLGVWHGCGFGTFVGEGLDLNGKNEWWRNFCQPFIGVN